MQNSPNDVILAILRRISTIVSTFGDCETQQFIFRLSMQLKRRALFITRVLYLKIKSSKKIN